MTKRKIVIFTITLAILILIIYVKYNFPKRGIISPLGENSSVTEPKPLDKYSFENLRERQFEDSQITFGKVLKEENRFFSRVFYYTSDGKKVSGLANIPKITGKLPVIVMLRGFVDQEIYTVGEGTRRSGEVFAENGFLTLAPDFLGYGQSSSPSANPIEERFETYTTALNLLTSIKTLDMADFPRIGIWGHSNGGHIALSILAITGQAYPTVLWAPVSKPFPYSILYFTDEFEDHGKKLRKVVSDFEKDYDVEKYTFTNYLDWISAPIQLHQGSEDEAVPQKWSDQFVDEMRKLKKDITYYTYPGDDHNFAKGSWNLVVLRNISFFRNHLNRL
ncbi:hypothetical protein A2960_02635 [Candidatus Gottesmanbacteria bacterium RIFCSPLOWO2_01_FULL_39_12b]|uniref:Peptidase S9 prolyl oligopeptidase catalytic domain-containing protein n=1 Tax=Candidatus Gottesmanbacteria bacterium RIFCSPLOWO2_01_FULL_39_12b TaxID=1798388 RepID=A0A1F6AQS7_9BACT|nr:MAG: hypothetical protein A2960_02635 [Candidatus Gottesmanbacteria bacterium RIFCSPLOWO2_01_FULL_39_12b]